MIDSVQIMALLDDVARHKTLAEIFHNDGTILERIVNADFGRDLKHLSKCIGSSTEVAENLHQIGKFFSESFLLELLRKELKNYSKCDLYTLSARVVKSSTYSGVLLYRDENISISVVTIFAIEEALNEYCTSDFLKKSEGVAFSALDTSLHIVKSNSAVMHKWSANKIDFATPLNSELFCSHDGTATLKAGDSIFLKGGESSCSIDCSSGSAMILSVSATTIKSPVNAEYDRHSRALAGVSAADIQSSRIQILSTFLRTMRSDAVFDALPSMLNHRDHFVRWYVMREMLASDTERAMPYLNHLHLTDMHPQVVKAASATLQLMNLK